MPDLEMDDIQGLIARGYPNLKAAGYVLLQIDDPVPAKTWLSSLATQVSEARARPEDIALNVAFTVSGLRKLGLAEDVLGQFSNEFSAGMTTAHRRRTLGDVGDNAPERWLWGGPNTPTPDVLLLLYAGDEAALAERYAALAAGFGQSGVSLVLKLDAVDDLDGKEQFGFRDGISQPTIDGLSKRVDIPSNTVQPGEFILGYGNEYGRYTDRPLLDPSADPGNVLPMDVQGSGKADLARNGSYLVFRQLAQDVHALWHYVDQATRTADGSSDPHRREWLAAKMVGRWPSGAPMTLTPDHDDELLAQANDFSYQYGDEFGLNCPIGSHIRRSHPRDSLDPYPGTASSVALDKRHRLLRRGREYGPPVDDHFAPKPPDDPERGLYFIAVAGNISRQFELIQTTWLSSTKFDRLYDEAPPLAAHRSPGPGHFTVPADPVRLRFTDLPKLVTVRGGAYFFLPGIRALKYLASLPEPPSS